MMLASVPRERMLSPYLLLGCLLFPDSPTLHVLSWVAMGFGTLESFMYHPYLYITIPAALLVHGGTLLASNRPPIQYENVVSASLVIILYMSLVEWPYRIPQSFAIAAFVSFMLFVSLKESEILKIQFSSQG